MAEIVIYTQPWCPYCMATKELLDKKQLAYREINAPHGTPEREDAIRLSGGRTTVPQIFIGGRPLGGYDDLNEMDAAGKLDALLAAGDRR